MLEFEILARGLYRPDQLSITYDPTLVEPHELVERSPRKLEKEASLGHSVGMNKQTEPMDASRQFCPNLDCKARGQQGQGNIVIHSRQRPRYRCKTCGKTFSAKEGTLFAGLRKPTELIVVVITLLAYGCPVQAIVQAFGLDERTVASWRDRAGTHCQHVHQALVEQGQLDLVHVQADEMPTSSCVSPSK